MSSLGSLLQWLLCLCPHTKLCHKGAHISLGHFIRAPTICLILPEEHGNRSKQDTVHNSCSLYPSKTKTTIGALMFACDH